MTSNNVSVSSLNHSDWRQANGGYRALAGALECEATPAGGAEAPLLRLRPADADAGSIAIQVPSVSFRSGTDWAMAALGQSDWYTQAECLHIQSAAERVFGLRTHHAIRVAHSRVDIEIELLTRAPLDEVDCAVRIVWRGAEPANVSASDRAAAPTGVRRWTLANSSEIALFADLRDQGTIEESPSAPPGGAVTVHFFRRPLEKGVILVGRLAFLHFAGAADPATLSSDYAAWLEGRSFL